jgi:predicted transcriptional regulator
MTLLQSMRTHFTVLDPDHPLQEAAALMAQSGYWLLPVCAGQRLVGSLSLLDIVAHGVADGMSVEGLRVRDAMNPEVLSCDVDTSLDDVRDLLRSHRQPAVCVTSADAGVVGLIDAVQVLELLTTPGGFAGPEPDEVRRVRGKV